MLSYKMIGNKKEMHTNLLSSIDRNIDVLSFLTYTNSYIRKKHMCLFHLLNVICITYTCNFYITYI